MDLRKAMATPTAFRESLMIDSADGSGPRNYGESLDPWQVEDFRLIDAAMMRAAGRPVDVDAKSRVWLERPRGHSKSTDVMSAITWLAIASQRKASVACVAGDKDQATLNRDAVAGFVKLNPWLGTLLKVDAFRIRNVHTETTVEILSSDAPSAFGLRSDAVILDEVSHWEPRSEALWDAMLSTVAKRQSAVMLCISNAGLTSSWQFDLREKIRADESWAFSRQPGCVASWITPEILAEQQRLLRGPAFARLWENEWVEGEGDAFDPDTVAAAIDSSLQPHEHAMPGYTYAMGADLGVSKDSAAVCVIGKHHASGKYVLANLRKWTPTKNRKVSLDEVKDHIVDLHARFRFSAGLMDSWQGVLLSEQLKAKRVPVELYHFPPANWHRLATFVLDTFSNGMVRLYDCKPLLADLNRTTVVESTSGNLRLHHPRIDGSHGDASVSFYLGLFAAQSARKPVVIRRPVFVAPNSRQRERRGPMN